jgi:hypothetical protein
MSLDYSGKPKFKKDRNLDSVGANIRDGIEERIAPVPQPKADQLFDNLTRAYLKGEALRRGIAEMEPAAFIPVEESAPVIAAIQRIAPNQGNFRIITFGLYMEACDALAEHSRNVDEEFLTNTLKVVDESEMARTFTKTIKGQYNTENDAMASFFDLLLPIAGIWLAGLFTDFSTVLGAKTGTDSMGGSGEVPTAAAPGALVGIVYLIEIGITVAMFLAVFKSDSKTKDDYTRLANDPEERRKILEEAGVDYDKLKKNQAWNDYTAIKEYSIKYIHKNPQTAKYDHWLGYVSTVQTQGILRSTLAMAPKFSPKWKNFHASGGFDAKSNADNVFESLEGYAQAKAESSGSSSSNPSTWEKIGDEFTSKVSADLESYFQGLTTTSNGVFDATAQAYYFSLDERIVCCLVYFIGPFDTSMLKTISSLLQLLLLRPHFSLSDFIENLVASIFNTILQMLNSYIHQIISQLFDKIYRFISKIPGTDLEAALAYCIGLEIIFKIIDAVLAMILKFVGDILKWLKSLYSEHIGMTSKVMEVTIEKRAMLTLAAMLDALAAKIDDVQHLCAQKDGDDAPDIINEFLKTGTVDELAAMRTLDFISNEMPVLFPVLELSEEVRRKHFRSVTPFVTPLGVPVAGFDKGGAVAYHDLVQDCADNSPASKITVLADKIANALKEEAASTEMDTTNKYNK